MDALEVAEYRQGIGIEALPANDVWGVLIFVGTLAVAVIATYRGSKHEGCTRRFWGFAVCTGGLFGLIKAKL